MVITESIASFPVSFKYKSPSTTYNNNLSGVYNSWGTLAYTCIILHDGKHNLHNHDGSKSRVFFSLFGIGEVSFSAFVYQRWFVHFQQTKCSNSSSILYEE